MVYFIASRYGNDIQSGSLECGEIKTNEDYTCVVDNYKKSLRDTYGYELENIVITAFNRL